MSKSKYNWLMAQVAANDVPDGERKKTQRWQHVLQYV